MHAEAFAFVSRQLEQLPPRRRVVELGGLNLNGGVRPLFVGAVYTSVDIAFGRDVDVVADAADYQPEIAPDTVVCCEVLEHAEQAEEIVRNAHRMLTPGGVLILTCASTGRTPHSAIDGGGLRDGEFYRNVAQDTLIGWLANFWYVQVDYHERGDVYAYAVKESA